MFPGVPQRLQPRVQLLRGGQLRVGRLATVWCGVCGVLQFGLLNASRDCPLRHATAVLVTVANLLLPLFLLTDAFFFADAGPRATIVDVPL